MADHQGHPWSGVTAAGAETFLVAAFAFSVFRTAGLPFSGLEVLRSPLWVFRSSVQSLNDRPQTTGLPTVGTGASRKEASQDSDVDAYKGRSGQVEDVSEFTRNTSEQTAPQGVDDTVVPNSTRQEKVTSKSDKKSTQFGLSLPLRTKQEDDDNGSELSSDDDEERLDPAWGIKRMDTSQVLAQVQRSPSFPPPDPRSGGRSRYLGWSERPPERAVVSPGRGGGGPSGRCSRRSGR